jgi:hypothetical protein
MHGTTNIKNWLSVKSLRLSPLATQSTSCRIQLSPVKLSLNLQTTDVSTFTAKSDTFTLLLLHALSYLQCPMAMGIWFGGQTVQTLVLSKVQLRLQQSWFLSVFAISALHPHIRRHHVYWDTCSWDTPHSSGRHQTAAFQPPTYGLLRHLWLRHSTQQRQTPNCGLPATNLRTQI